MNNQKKSKFSLLKWCKDNQLYLLSFILPVIAMLVVYFIKDVQPFGDFMYLRSDCYHQYAPYLQILQDKIANMESLKYTWNIGGGMNFIAVIAYYASSPLNFLTLLIPGKISDVVSFFIILKMGLSSFSVTYYLTKKYGQKNMATVIFGLLYALSAYFAAFSWNIMWLDCMWLFPFIILGIDKLVTKRECYTYCIALALGIFSNYYIGIMLCIFSVVYFIYALCVNELHDDLKHSKLVNVLLIFKDYALYSLLGGLLASCVILPEYFNLLTTKSADTAFPERLEKYYSFIYMLFRSQMAIPVADLKYAYDPNIYCSIAMFFLVPLFLFCKKINTKERIGKTILAIFMLLSFQFNIPNYIWHGFHFPNSLPCRQSFIYVFILVTMGYQAFIHLREFKAKHIGISFAIGTSLILLFEEIFKNAEFFSDLEISTDILKITYLSLLFLGIYAVLIYFYRRKPQYNTFLTYLLILAFFSEMTINFSITGIASCSSKFDYYNQTTAYKDLEGIIDEDAKKDNLKFYRAETDSHATRNDGARYGYRSISTFSSVSSAAMQNYYDDIGLQTSFNAYDYLGHTPLTAALFNVNYEFSTSEGSLPNDMTLLSSANYPTSADNPNANGTLNVYKYNRILPLGFMINASTTSTCNLKSGNPFLSQNSFVSTAIAGKTIFHKLKAGQNVGSFEAEYNLDNDDPFSPTGKEETFDVYFFCNTDSQSLTATVSGGNISSSKDDVGNTNTKTFSSTDQNYICHLGNIPKGAKVTVTGSDGKNITNCYAYAFDEDAWSTDHALLAESPFQVTKFEDTLVEGKIHAKQDGLMYTSIPYDEGWSVEIDGEESEVQPICDGALTGVILPEGDHIVTFDYHPRGFLSGMLLTILCVIILLGIIFKDKIIAFAKKSKEKDDKRNAAKK